MYCYLKRPFLFRGFIYYISHHVFFVFTDPYVTDVLNAIVVDYFVECVRAQGNEKESI